MYYPSRKLKRVAAAAVIAVAGIVVLNCLCGAAERDPFASPLSEREEAVLVEKVEKVDEIPDLCVTGIMRCGKKDLAAIVNGRVVRVNDRLDGKKVIDINLDEGKVVLLDDGNRRYVLRLNQKERK